MARRRSPVLLALAAFLLATGVQSIFHAHVGGDRHHVAGCDDNHAMRVVHAHSLAAHTGVVGDDDPASRTETPRHAACARCVPPAADTRVACVSLEAPAASAPVSRGDRNAMFRAAERLVYGLRGPPAA